MFELRRQRGGVQAVHHTGLGETMHPGAGPWAEATGLYVRGAGLAKLLRQGERELVVFDVGLGAAANALAACACHQELRRSGTAPRPLRLVSFEHDLGALALALREPQALPYVRGHEATLQALLEAGTATPGEGITWELRHGDFMRLIHEEPHRADVVFHDPFSPRSNAALWSLPALRALYGCRRRGGDTVLVTYSSAFGVRAGLLLAGFFVGEGPSPTGRPTTVAATALSLLERPLTGAWLQRWRHDKHPWPPEADPAQRPALREALLEHPQWQSLAAPSSDQDAPRPPGKRATRSGKRPPRRGRRG